jgi:hypothetical protein
MKPIFILTILLTCISFSFESPKMLAKEKHYGKVYAILGDYVGDIYIKLNKENEEMIEVEMEAVTEKSKGSMKKMSSTIKLNTAAISKVVIDSITYKVRNIEVADGKL